MSKQSLEKYPRHNILSEAGERWEEKGATMILEASPLDEKQIMDLLAHVVEGEIIPRLMLAHQTFVSTQFDANLDAAMSEDAIEQFAQLTLSGEVDDLEDHIVSLTRQGVVVETVYLQLMAPTARKLGEYWERDICSFTEVTIGLGRLQTLLYRLSARHKGLHDAEILVARGLFVTPYGAQHSFGIRMVEDIFRRAGWKTLCEPNILTQDLVALLQAESFDLVGIGISIVGQLELTREMIFEIRQSSRNQNIKIMVGGNLIVEQSELADSLGADFSAKDAREAVTIAQNVIYDQKMRY
jgi:MerR family transcriptional regulator, light-induced transcriptional regulator